MLGTDAVPSSGVTKNEAWLASVGTLPVICGGFGAARVAPSAVVGVPPSTAGAVVHVLAADKAGATCPVGQGSSPTKRARAKLGE